MQYKNLVLEFDEMLKERNALFISVHFGNVINSFKNQAKEWLDKHGNVMRIIGEKELIEIKKGKEKNLMQNLNIFLTYSYFLFRN